MPDVITAEGLHKSFGEVHALDGLDLSVPRGSVRALLGPNGAGKTTVCRILTTLLQADAGRAIVAGVDVAQDPQEVRRRIGMSGQFAAVDEDLTARENVELVARLYHLGRSRARQRADELMTAFDLQESADRVVKGYSGGMRRRVDLACALVADPPVLFLDEPTTGLDPRSRGQVWDLVRDLVTRGSTVLLTTQYLEEADQLADDIAVIDHGRVVAEGTPTHLKAHLGGDRLELTITQGSQRIAAAHRLDRLASGPIEHREDDVIVVPVEAGERTLIEVVRELDSVGVNLASVTLRRPSLEEVFLSITALEPAVDAPTEQEKVA